MSYPTPAGHGRSAAFGAAMARSAEKRRCPKCGRKSALVRVDYEVDPFIRAYCRWDDCGYAKERSA